VLILKIALGLPSQNMGYERFTGLRPVRSWNARFNSEAAIF